MSGIKLYPHQKKAIDLLRTGSILQGGVGSGKSLTAIAFYNKDYRDKHLHIITTAKKRDSGDWERECSAMCVFPCEEVESWNNIKKFEDVKNAFFIFDEQRVIGSGSWVKSFLKIVKSNDWILLSATPGDTWMDYIPVFVANRFYKNRTEFIKRHVVFNRFLKYPKVDRYVEEDRLEKLKKYITVHMDFDRKVEKIYEDIVVEHDKDLLNIVVKDRWDPYENKPVRDISRLIFLGRKVINSAPERIGVLGALLEKHRKIIVFYNYNYELKLLKEFNRYHDIEVAEYNGHKHEDVPKSEKWLYLVQYMSGSEGWNCIETNTIVFYSLNYSYRIMTQAAGRIDRLNTPFNKLYYYRLVSNSSIDFAIKKAITNKKNFNKKLFAKETYHIIEGV